MNHEQIRELLGAYAVDAVEETERRAVELHLDTCDACVAEVGRHLEAASFLASDPTSAPSELWERIQAAIHEDGSRRVVPMRRRRLATWIGAAAAVAAVAVSTVLTVDALSDQRRLEDRVNDLAATLERSGAERAAQAALLDPRSKLVVLRSPDSSLLARVVYLPDGHGYLVDHNLDPLAEGRAYQLWVLAGDRKVSAGVLGASPGVVGFAAAGEIAGFAITAEDGSGAAQPTSDPVVVGFLT